VFSLVIADAQRLLRESLGALLESTGRIRVVGDVSDGRQLVDVCRDAKPDVALVDVRLPRLSGIEAIRRIRGGSTRTRFVLTSALDSPGLVRAALLAGASGFVPKNATARDLLEALEASLEGGPFCAGATRGLLADAPATPGDESSPCALSGRQAEVLQLIAEGLSTREIAHELGVSIKTAQTHRVKLMQKVGAHKASELIRYAIREGLVEA